MINFVGIANTAVQLVGRSVDLSRHAESESGVARALQAQQNRPAGDSLDLRTSNLKSDQLNIRNTGRQLQILQSRRTINQSVSGTIGMIETELGNIRTIIEDVESGSYSEAQIKNFQLQIESGIAQLESRVNQTKFGNSKLLTGEPVRMITDPETREGIEVQFGDLSASGLGLDTLDITTPSGRTAALEVIESAMGTTTGIFGKIKALDSAIDQSAGEQLSELKANLASLRSHEILSTPGETRWLSSDGASNVLMEMKGKITSLAGSFDLNTGIVSELLRG